MKKGAVLLVFCLMFLPVISIAGDYVIVEGDGLDVSVWGNKELNVSVKVRPDGKITIPALGDVAASGLTPQELQKKLTENLKGLVKNPIVTVMVREIVNGKVYVFGGGINSGVYDLNRKTSLLQLLCMIGNASAGDGKGGGTAAGGVAKVADYRNAYLIRKGVKLKEDFYNLFVKGDTSEDMAIESNDAVFIPQLTDRNIYVLGSVNQPKAFEYREGMTVMEAILESGGFTKFAKQNSTIILRKEKGKDVSIPVRAKDLINDNDLSQNIRLKPGDYVIVSEGMF